MIEYIWEQHPLFSEWYILREATDEEKILALAKEIMEEDRDLLIALRDA